MTSPLTLAPIEKLRNWISSQHTGLCKMLSKGDECDCPLCCLDNIADLLASAPQEPPQERDERWKKAINSQQQPTLCNGSDELRGLSPEETIALVHRHILEVEAATVKAVKVASAPQTGSAEALADKAYADCMRSLTPAEAKAWNEHDYSVRWKWRAILIEALSTASAPPQGWQPIATAPPDTECLWWVVPKTPIEAFIDTGGDPIFGTHPPYIHRGKARTWSSLSKALYWYPMPAPPSAPTPQETP